MHGQPQRAQVVGRTDARQHQQLRRMDGARAQQHFAPGGNVPRAATFVDFHAGGAAVLHADRAHLRARDQREVGAGQRRRQHRRRRGMPTAAMDRALAQSIAFGIQPREVSARGKSAKLREGVEERAVQRIGLRDVRHMDGAALAMYCRVARIRIVFRAAKQRQHARPIPAGVAGARPVVVVERMPAVVGHAVDRTGSADHLAAGQWQSTIVQRRLWFGGEPPAQALVQDRRPHQRRYMDEGMAGGSACLDEADAIALIF